jgi:hypothetical protein
MDASRRVELLKAKLARAEDSDESANQDDLLAELLSLEQYRRSMRDFASGEQ